MSRWRLVCILILLVTPVLIFVGVAGWSMWQTGRLTWWWWLMPFSWGFAFLLIRKWQEKLDPWKAPLKNPEMAWTPKDSQAAELLTARQRTVKEISPTQLTNPRLYLDTALEIAEELDRHYHPNSKQPFHALTIVEILAALHLASEDLEEWAETYVPGSYALTIQQWRNLSQAPSWISNASNASWAISLLWNPANIARLITSKMTMGPLSRELQNNVLAAFYVMFIRRLGVFLIEMNSGRLRAGSARYEAALKSYRQRMSAGGNDDGKSSPLPEGTATEVPDQRIEEPDASDAAGAPTDDVVPASAGTLTLAIIGQMGAGKSSVLNAIVGEEPNKFEVLSGTQNVRKCRHRAEASSDELILLDCPGYGGDQGESRRLKDIRLAVFQADLVLMVMKATSPARDADRQMLAEISSWYEANPRLSAPPVLGVLTHIDALSPSMEWSPPYNFQEPEKPKEVTISAALDSISELFGEQLSGIVPVCADLGREREYGIEELLIPAVSALLDSAHACCLIRTLHSEVKKQRTWKVLSQLYNAGAAVLSQTWHSQDAAHIREGEDPRF